MNIKMVPVEKVIPYDNNPRHNDEAVDVVAASIKAFGFKVPIVIDSKGIIVTGHTRHKAALSLGLKEVPCIEADDLTPDQIKAFRLVDNKTSEYATWDFGKLESELRGIEFDMKAFDFKLPETPLEEDDFDIDAAVKAVDNPMTKPGQVWKLGRHRLMCGDSTKPEDFGKLMKGEKVDIIIITDPPYNVGLGYNETPEQAALRNRRTDSRVVMNDQMKDSDFRSFLRDAYKRMVEVMKPGAPIYVFHADTEGYNFRGALIESGITLRQTLIWVKNSLIMGRQDYQWRHEPILYGWKEGAAHRWYGDRDKSTVFEEIKHINPNSLKKSDLVDYIKRIQSQELEGTTIIKHDKPSSSLDHPTMKPVALLGKLLFNSSEKGDLCLDSFGGSGSTLIACEQSSRICYTMELDPVYCDVIINRWEELTGEEAQLEV